MGFLRCRVSVEGEEEKRGECAHLELMVEVLDVTFLAG